MKPEEERALAHSYAQRLTDLLNEIERSDEHALIPFADEGVIKLEGKYGYQASVQDTCGHGWVIEQ